MWKIIVSREKEIEIKYDIEKKLKNIEYMKTEYDEKYKRIQEEIGEIKWIGRHNQYNII